MNQSQQTVSQSYPGGCYFGFNAAIDRKSAEQIAFVCADAMRNGYAEINLLISSTGGILDHAYDGLPEKMLVLGNMSLKKLESQPRKSWDGNVTRCLWIQALHLQTESLKELRLQLFPKTLSFIK